MDILGHELFDKLELGATDGSRCISDTLLVPYISKVPMRQKLVEASV
jgi:hypothetical protein